MVTEFQVTEEDASHLQWTIEVFLESFTKLHPMLVLPPICTILFTCHNYVEVQLESNTN